MQQGCEQSFDFVDKELKLFIDKEVQCVDFKVIDGEPGLDLELNSGEMVRKVVDVKRPPGIGVQPYMNEVMSINELSGMDEVEFQLHEHDHSPGVLLKQSGTVSWTLD